MTVANALDALAEHWDDVLAGLNPGQRPVLLGLTRELLGAEGVARRDVTLDLIEFLATVLPPAHPVRRAFAAESSKFEVGRAAGDREIQLLWRRLEDAQSADLDPVRLSAENFLLGAMALNPDQVRRGGTDPGRQGLIRLAAPDGTISLPAFQFGGDGQPLPVVAAINRLLDADDDPWGVADWWLGPNARIDAVPAEMIGRLADEVLVEVARAVLEED